MHAGMAGLQRLDLGWCASITDADARSLTALTGLTDLQLSRTLVRTLAHGRCPHCLQGILRSLYIRSQAHKQCGVVLCPCCTLCPYVASVVVRSCCMLGNTSSSAFRCKTWGQTSLGTVYCQVYSFGGRSS